jgi:hypothetical protein
LVLRPDSGLLTTGASAKPRAIHRDEHGVHERGHSGRRRAGGGFGHYVRIRS